MTEDHRSWSYSPPSGCRHCGIGEYMHVSRYVDGAGRHVYTPPTDEQIRTRMAERRAAAQALTRPIEAPR